MSTVGNLLRSVLPEALSDDTASRWPPDVFCLAASILKASGSYVHVLRKWPSEFSVRPVSDAGSWAEWARRVGQLWRRASAEPNAPAPDVVRSLWATVVEKDALPLAEVHGDSAFCCALLELVALADEACAGVGISDASEDDFLRRAQSLLLATPDGSASLCSEKISPAVARVLPKQHTPGTGLTLRSLTHHLALHQGNEVVPKWISVPRVSQATPTINLLLAPWPLVLRPKQFREATGTLTEMPKGFRFMALDLDSDEGRLEQWTKALVNEAIGLAGRIDGIVFPEMSFADRDIPAVRRAAAAAGAFVIAGVVSDGPPVKNSLVFSSGVGAGDVEIRQDKHHRWRLDRSQVEMYGLGGTLEPTFDWWELTEIGRREVNFLTLDERMTVCCLVCEDLARQDPVAELVRSVGPNLVVALLMDAAQVAVRWPARYATVLADDPGSSVLTLTSAGMVNLARTPPGKAPSRSIALWRDARTGTTEIELPGGAQGVVLSLYLERSREWSADGRQDDPAGASYGPRLGGIHPIFFSKTSMDTAQPSRRPGVDQGDANR